VPYSIKKVNLGSAYRLLPGLARFSISAFYRGDNTPPPTPKPINHVRAGVFVSLETKKDNSLRGCVGTLTPTCSSIWEETYHNARKAAFEDNRFLKLEERELDSVNIEVSILHRAESLPDHANLDICLNPDKYGIIIRSQSGRRALLLPGIAGVRTWRRQIAICRQKAAISKEEAIRIQRFKVDKFFED
jgi:AmmeMemoRadiSam system protein A